MADENKDTNDVKAEKKPKKKRSLFRRIVNWFLYICLGIIVLILVVLGITQTSTFKEYLRKTVIEQADSALYGKVYIEKIEGTLLTSLLLKNTVVNLGKDTLLHAEVIDLKTSPLQLLLKKIKIRYFEIKNADISLIQDSAGVLNISKLVKPTPKDTTPSGKFPFKIDVADFRLTNINFNFQRYDYVNSSAYYDTLYMKDFRARNLNLQVSAFANISENDYELALKHLSMEANLNNFDLKNLTGDFKVTKQELTANNLKLLTGNSDLGFSARLNGYNLFDSTHHSEMGNAAVTASIEAGKFSFSDLVPFVPSMNKMKGAVATQINISGTVNNLSMDKLKINYLNTQLAAKGSVKDLLKSGSMYIKTAFYDTYVNPADIMTLMPGFTIPGYKELGVLRFDTLLYEGSPKNFKTNLQVKTDKGIVSANGTLNMESSVMAYNLKLQTQNLDISPFARNMTSNLNMHASVEGKGTSPEELNALVSLNADGSVFNGNKIDTLRLDANAHDKKITYTLLTTSDSMGVNIGGNVDFTNHNNPAYKLDGTIHNLNLAAFTKDTSSQSSMNFNIAATGENFDPELMNLYLTLTMYQSTIHGIHIDTTRAIVDLRRDDGGQRVINLISDIADVTFMGNFSVPKTIQMLSSEAGSITSILNTKLNQIDPSLLSSTNISTAPIVKPNRVNYVERSDSLTSITYLVDLKSLDLLSLFMGGSRVEVDGELSGKINNTGDSLSVTLDAAIDYVKYWGGNNIFFLSNLNLDFNAANPVNATALSNIYADMTLSTDRIFAGTDIHNLKLNMRLQNQTANIDFSTFIENYADAKITGAFDLSGNRLGLLLDTLRLTYNNFTLQNDSTVNIAYSQAGININNLSLARNGGIFSAQGVLSKSGNQDLNISLTNFSGRDVAENLLLSKQENSFDALINLKTKISGTSANPLINIKFDVDSVKYQNNKFGSLTAALDYNDKNLAVDMRFIDSVITANEPAMHISGNVPIDLAFSGVTKRFSDSKEMNLKLQAQNFNLAALGDMLPAVNKLRGTMAANLTVTGTPQNINPSGTLTLSNAGFIVEMTNLEYNAGLKVTIAKDFVSLDSLTISNVPGTKGGGTMTGSGKAQMNNFNITSSQFSINGELKVLDDISKASGAPAYGTLIIATRGNVQFVANENQTVLTAPVTIKEADLTFPPSPSAYKNTASNFIYKYVADTNYVAGTGPGFDELVNLSKQRGEQQKTAAQKAKTFDFTIDLKIADEATIVFPLSKEINQNLTAVLSGGIIYESIEGRKSAQGEFKLMEGSTLEFIKTLQAEGTITFENDLADPYLDITATYLDYYYKDAAATDNTDNASSLGATQTSGDQLEIPVAVKIKIKGLLSELDKNFMQEENNIAVYYGQENIQNDVPDPRFDKTSALLFIITGDFVGSTSASTNTKFASSQAASIAGSVLSGFLNKATGNYIKSVEVRQVGTQTKFNVTGRAGKFRYSLGGTSQVFQDLSQANVRIEYPLIQELLLRLERKQALNTESSIGNEMINELGLRYRFEF